MGGWRTIGLAVIEGLTEFLPVSSTGHLILASWAMGVKHTEFVKSFEIAIQLGAILAVVGLYVKKLTEVKTMAKVAVAFIPTGVVGMVAYPMIKTYLLGNAWITIGSLVVGGLVMMGWKPKDRGGSIEDLKWGQAVMIGIVQAVAVIPGVSRAMATILGGMGAGLSRLAATEMSFLLAVPTMAAATGWDLVKSGASFTLEEWVMLGVGVVVAWGTAILAIKWLLGYVAKHDFWAFGVYRIVVAGLFAMLLA